MARSSHSTGGLLLGSSCTSKLLDQLVLLEVATELVVIDALLEPDQDVVQLDVELSALLKLHRKLLLHDDGLVDRGKELALRWVVSNRIH